MITKCYLKLRRSSVWSVLVLLYSTTSHAAQKGLMGHIENTTQDGVYSLFNLVFSQNGGYVLLGLAAFVGYLFWQKS